MRRADLCEGHKPTHLKYRITCEEYAQLLARFGGLCDRCGQVTVAPVIDHDYVIGDAGVRGMVCHRCNIIIGCVEQGSRSEDALTTAYLRHPFHPSIPVELEGYRVARDPELADLVGVEGAASILRTTRKGIGRMVRCGKLAGMTVDETWVFRRAVIEAAKDDPQA